MNKYAMALLLLANSVVAAEGVWLGGALGVNRSGYPGLDYQSATAYALEGGYNWNVASVLLGVEGFVDWSDRAIHNPGQLGFSSRAYGVDGRMGLPLGDWLPYVAAGYAHMSGGAASGNALHFGCGVEYRLMPGLSIAAQYGESAVSGLSHKNMMLGLRYYFDEPHDASARLKTPEPEPVKAEPAVVEEKVVWKTLREEKPVTFSGMHFDEKSVRLLESERSRLEDVAEFARLYPATRLEISGHTDYRAGQSKRPYNMRLSEQRAMAFAEALVKMGVAAERISMTGYGFDRPVADNGTEAGRASNRRVEIRSVVTLEKRVPE